MRQSAHGLCMALFSRIRSLCRVFPVIPNVGIITALVLRLTLHQLAIRTYMCARIVCALSENPLLGSIYPQRTHRSGNGEAHWRRCLGMAKRGRNGAHDDEFREIVETIETRSMSSLSIGAARVTLPPATGDPITAGDSATPTVAVIVPTLNEARNLALVLPQIAAMATEVIVVDGRSMDHTVRLAELFVPNVRVIQQTGRGKGDALRCGIEVSSSDIIVLMDADGSTDPQEIPTVRPGATARRRLRQRHTVRTIGRKRRPHKTAKPGQPLADEVREHRVGQQLYRSLLRLQCFLADP